MDLPNSQPNKNPQKPRTHEPENHPRQMVLIGLWAFLVGGGLIYYATLPHIDDVNPVVKHIDKFNRWQTHINKEYGFEFKYPVNFVLVKDKNVEGRLNLIEQEFAKKTNEEIMRHTIIFDTTKDTLTHVINSLEATRGWELKEKITKHVGSNDWVFIKNFEPASNTIFRSSVTEKNGRVFGFADVSQYPELEQIVSSFKFIDAEADTSGWKTYKNEEYGFEFKYPGNWTYDMSDSGLMIFFDRADPTTGKRVFSEGSGVFSIAATKGSIENFLTNDRACEENQAVILGGKGAVQRDCPSEYGEPFTLTVLPLTASGILQIQTGVNNTVHTEILSTFKFTN